MPILSFNPILANALEFALSKATIEGKITISILMFVSLLSWNVIFTKIWQLAKAGKASRAFYEDYNKTHDPMELSRNGKKYNDAPAYQVYSVAVDSITYHLKQGGTTLPNGERRMSNVRYDQVRVAMERATSNQILGLEKGMVVLTTAVAGGPFLGLLGTVWGQPYRYGPWRGRRFDCHGRWPVCRHSSYVRSQFYDGPRAHSHPAIGLLCC